jgi:hypothetical protein
VINFPEFAHKNTLLGIAAVSFSLAAPAALAQTPNIDISKKLVEAINAAPGPLHKHVFPNGMPKNMSLKAAKVSKASLTSGPMVFKWNTLPSAKPLVALEADFINCNSSPQTMSYTFTESKTQETSYEFSYGFTQSISATITGTTPFGEVSGEVGFSANQQITNAKTNSQTVDWSIPIQVSAAPDTYQVGQMLLTTNQMDGTFTMPVYASGMADIDMELTITVPGMMSMTSGQGPVKIDLAKLIPDREKRKFVLAGAVNGVTYGKATGVVGPAQSLTDPALRKTWCPQVQLTAAAAGAAPAAMKAEVAPAAIAARASPKAAAAQKAIEPIANAKVLATAEPRRTPKK